MKIFKSLLLIVLIIFTFNRCNEDDSLEELQASAPTDIAVDINITQDNTGQVTIIPSGISVSSFRVFFGDVENEEPTVVLPGFSVEHVYAAGTYEVKIIGVGPTGLTNEYTQSIVVSGNDPIQFPIDFESFTIYEFVDFGGTNSSVIDNPNASGTNSSSKVGRSIKNNGAETFAGSTLVLEEPIDFSSNKLIQLKINSPKSGITVKLKVENGSNENISHEVDVVNSVSNDWEELSFDFGSIDTSQEYQKLTIFFDFGNTGDDTEYLFDDIILTTSVVASIEGVWKLAPEAGALGVGPARGDISWFNCDEACVSARACFYDDLYVFDTDGIFSNILGGETWVEAWQGGGDSCGTPVAPHNGSNPATYTYDQVAGTVTLTGEGAYIGLAKANNEGELPNVPVPNSITYEVSFIDDNTLSVIIETGSGSGVFWQFRLIRENPTIPIQGVWKLAPEAGSLGVGPAPGDVSWFNCDDACVEARACYYNDLYVFGADGSFNNVMGGETWVEAWQGGTDACGTPVAPHNGTNAGTYLYDEAAGTLTINGEGSFVGLAKASNAGELPGVPVPSSITYNVTSLNDDSLSLVIETGSGVFWQFRLVKL